MADLLTHEEYKAIAASLELPQNAWIDGAYAAGEAISQQAGPDEFNQIIDDLNAARSEALGLCDAMYR